MARPDSRAIRLPPVAADDLQALLRSRRSVKDYLDRALPLHTAASVLAAMAGPARSGRRVVASARSSYPLAVTLIAGRVDGLDAGAYRYRSAQHVLESVRPGDHRPGLATATLDAEWLANCPMVLLVSADMRAARTRFADQPPEHGERFVWLEAGCMAQNAYLWAARHGQGTVLIAGLDDRRAHDVAIDLLPADHTLLGMLPLGSPAMV